MKCPKCGNRGFGTGNISVEIWMNRQDDTSEIIHYRCFCGHTWY